MDVAARRPGSDTGATLRGVGWVMAQRVLHVLQGALFAVVLPRLMGPSSFGQYALLVSVSLWFTLLSSLGAVSMMTRSVPAFVLRGDANGLRRLVSGLLGLRAATGLGAATLYLVVTTVWLREVDAFSLACIAGAVFCRATANLCFALFLGLNQAARWGIGELLRKWLVLVLVAGGFVVGGLRGACAGVFAANLAVLAVGLWGSRDHLKVSHLWPDMPFLAPFLRTGAYFTGGNLLLAMAQRSGEAVVSLSTGDFVQVAYYGAAYAMYMAGAQALWSLAVAFAPMLVGRAADGRSHDVGRWLERLLTWMTIGTSLALIGVILAADDVVPMLLGRAYTPVARNMLPLVLALVARAPASVARLQSLVADRPGDAAVAAALELAAFLALGPWLAAAHGSFGACVAALAGVLVNAAWLSWRLRGAFPYSFRPAVGAALLVLPVAPLGWVHASWAMEVLLLALALGGYGVMLVAFRVVRRDDPAAIIRALWTSNRPVPAAEG